MQKVTNNIQEQISLKPSMENLNELEAKILDKMNELFQAINKQFADKNDVKKQIK